MTRALKGSLAAMAASVLALSLPAPTVAVEGSIQIKGSDTMVNLCQAWAEAFMAAHPKVVVAVTGGGSGTGIAALINGTAEIAASSRAMTKKERDLAQQQGAAPKEWTAALDGLAVVVHPDNLVRRLTLQQLAQIFTGQIQNWRELGGETLPIVLLSREVNSGTHVYFKEHVLGGAPGTPAEFAPEALLLPSSQAIADEAASNTAAIGYYGMGYITKANGVVAVAKTEAGPYVEPTEDAVRSGAYPISRPLFLYTRGDLGGTIKTFLDFVLSLDGQRIVRAVDFVPVAP